MFSHAMYINSFHTTVKPLTFFYIKYYFTILFILCSMQIKSFKKKTLKISCTPLIIFTLLNIIINLKDISMIIMSLSKLIHHFVRSISFHIKIKIRNFSWRLDVILYRQKFTSTYLPIVILLSDSFRQHLSNHRFTYRTNVVLVTM